MNKMKVLFIFIFISSSLYSQLIYEVRDVIVERYQPGGNQATITLKLFIMNLGNETIINTLNNNFRSILSYPKPASNDVYAHWDMVADFYISFIYQNSSIRRNRKTYYPSDFYIISNFDQVIPIYEKQFRMPYTGEDFGIEWQIVYRSISTKVDEIRMKILGNEYDIGEFKNLSKNSFIRRLK